MAKFTSKVPILALATAFVAFSLVAPRAMAGDPPAKATYRDIEQTLGSVPGMFKVFPEIGIAGAWIDLGGQQVHLVQAPVPHNLGQHFAIRVGDLDAVVRELRSKHIEVADPMSTGANRQTFINDPAGNAIELHQVGASVPSMS